MEDSTIFFGLSGTRNTRTRRRSFSLQLIALIRFRGENFADRWTTYDAFIESYDVAARLVHASAKDMKQLGFKRGFARDYPGLEHFTWRLDFRGLNFESARVGVWLLCVATKIYLLIKRISWFKIARSGREIRTGRFRTKLFRWRFSALEKL